MLNRHKWFFADFRQKHCSQKLGKIHIRATVLKSLFNKIAGHQVYNFVKKRLQHTCLPVNFAKTF